MSKPVTIIIPSYCPDETVRGYEARCLKAVGVYTPKHLADVVVQQGGDRSYPQKVNEIGLKAETQYICILSNDVFVGSPTWLDRLIKAHRVTACCGALAPQDSLGQPEITRNDHWWACVLIATWQFKFLGGLDESLPNVYHDQDFSIRLKNYGYDTCRTGAVVVEHVGLATRSRVGTERDDRERAEMIRRYGCAELSEYVRLHPWL